MKLVVLGHPVTHSISPAMMTSALAAAGIEGSYEARDIGPTLRRMHLDALASEGVRGANVTVPHKETALALAEEAGPEARECGAANVLTRDGARWRADNTDLPGFLDWVAATPAAESRVQSALVIGAGGAARAVFGALCAAGARHATLVNRTRARAALLARAFADRLDIDVVDDVRPEVAADALLVQCTSLGLRADDPLPVSPAAVARAGCVLDLVYPATALVRAARAHGVPAQDGTGLLVAQGARAFAHWTGVTPDRTVMLEAALREIERRRPSRK